MSIHLQIDLPDPDELFPEWWVTLKLIAGTELQVLARRQAQFKTDLGTFQLIAWVGDQLTDALHGDGLCDPFQPSRLRRGLDSAQ